jgi:hypothetical protein
MMPAFAQRALTGWMLPITLFVLLPWLIVKAWKENQ